ncbi:MAG TPA: pentapeptide repeat-containing protein [Chloroflexia bacterium]
MSDRRLRWALIIAGSALLAIVVFSLLVVLSLSLNWPARTGFTDYTTPKSDTLDYHPGKTLWDWLDLLVVPAVLVIGGIAFSWAERNSNNAIADRRIVEDRKIAEEQRSEDRRIEAERIAEEHRLQDDRIRDALLREYLDRMSDLLITHKLGSSNEGDPERLVARARTVTILNALGQDGARKGNIVRFLYEAKLLNKANPIVNLQGADLRHAGLIGANLSEANLNVTNLIEADFRGAKLNRADLSGADLSGAKLNRADLSGADLSGAFLENAKLNWADLSGANLKWTSLNGANLSRGKLSGVDLSGTDLSGADLSGVDLSGVDLKGAYLDEAVLSQALLTKANLTGARVTREQLESAADLTGAILPDHIQLTSIKP